MPPRAACLLIAAACLLGGCKDREIVTYRAPKDPAAMMRGSVMAQD